VRPLLIAAALAALAAPAAAQEAHMHGAPPPAPEAPAAAPPVADDWAADRYFDAQAMARARRVLITEHGGVTWSLAMADLAEYRSSGGGGYHWDGEASVGGDIDRLVVKTEGEGAAKGKLEHGEVQALWGHAVSPYYNLLAGVRRDVIAHGRTYASIGLEGLAPNFIETEAMAFLSDRGEISARGAAWSDFRLTQRLILQPRAEANIALRSAPEIGVGAGLSDAELGLRLRYEVVRQFAPYVGVVWSRSFGAGARARRAEGERAGQGSVVAGLRAWF
jgi:copper resistance protein B